MGSLSPVARWWRCWNWTPRGRLPPTATTTVPLPEEMVAEVVGLLEEGVVQPFSTSILPDPLPDWTVILTTTQATYYACFAGTSDPGLYRVDPSGDCTWSNLYSAPPFRFD